MRRRCLRATPRFTGLKKSAEECRRFIRDADNLVDCPTVEFEIELCFGATVVSVGKNFQLSPPETPVREPSAPDGDARARRLSW
jgi:hypothetical protein